MNIPAPLTGSHPLVGWLNKLRLAVIAERITSFQGGRMQIGAGGTQLIVGAGGQRGSSVNVATFVYASQSNDTLLCHPWDGTTEDTETDVYIAKPRLLRYASARVFPEKTISYDTYDWTDQTREAHYSGITEVQRITPRYVDGDIIVAIYLNPTLNGITDVFWADTNVDARAWAMKYIPPA